LRFGLSPIQSEGRFDAMLQQAALAEALGYDVLWAHEHHSGGMIYPSPLMTLAVLASATKRIGLGTNMLLLPLHHPLRVAEDGAIVDVLSGVRLRLGVGAGYSPTDLQAFVVPEGDRARRMREGLALIRAVWAGEHVSLENGLSQLTDFTLFPGRFSGRPRRSMSAPPSMRRCDGRRVSATSYWSARPSASATSRGCSRSTTPNCASSARIRCKNLRRLTVSSISSPTGHRSKPRWSSSAIAFLVSTTHGGTRT
jgi:Luciferase-like monooxygenase